MLFYYFASDDFSGINYYVPVPCFRASLGTTEQRMSASTTAAGREERQTIWKVSQGSLLGTTATTIWDMYKED